MNQKPEDLRSVSRHKLLGMYGYKIRDCGQYFVAFIEDDTDAFMVVLTSYIEAEREAYRFLYNEVDPDVALLPEPSSFD